MKRTTMFKMILMMVLIAGAMTLTRPSQASTQLISLSCVTECISTSGVNHNCTMTILGLPVHLDLGINKPVQACGPISTVVFDPVTQRLCGLTPDAAAGIVVPVQDACGSYEVFVVEGGAITAPIFEILQTTEIVYETEIQ
jgi:hypothetical protein